MTDIEMNTCEIRTRSLSGSSFGPNSVTPVQSEDDCLNEKDSYSSEEPLHNQPQKDLNSDSSGQMIPFNVALTMAPPQCPESQEYEQTSVSIQCYSSKSGKTSESGEKCSICLENIFVENNAMIMMPCEHEFHQACILSWFERSNLCPFCKRDFRQLNYKSFFDQLPDDHLLKIWYDRNDPPKIFNTRLEPAIQFTYNDASQRIRICLFLNLLGCFAAHAILLLALSQIARKDEFSNNGFIIAGSFFLLSHFSTMILQGVQTFLKFKTITKWMHHVVADLTKTETSTTRQWKAIRSLYFFNVGLSFLLAIWYIYMGTIYLDMIYYTWIICGMIVLFGWNVFMYFGIWSVGKEYTEEWWAQVEHHQFQSNLRQMIQTYNVML